MKKSYLLLCLSVLLIGLCSCDDQLASLDRVSFDRAFPKPNKNLTAILGERLKLKSGSDTLELRITSEKHANLIIEEQTGDTVFYGKVSKFRGLYYFSQAINDSSYHIHAVKLSDGMIYGLTSVYQQNALIDEEVRKGKLPELVKYISPDSSTFRLRADKRGMKKLYSGIISTILPDTILQSGKRRTVNQNEIVATEQIIDVEESELFYSVYPNPVTDFVNVALQTPTVSYQLIDINGKRMATGQLNKAVSKINTAKLQKGVYILILISADGLSSESVRLVKS